MNFYSDISLYDWIKVFSIQVSRPFRLKEFVNFLKKQASNSMNEEEIVNQVKQFIDKGMLVENSGNIYISKRFPDLDNLYLHFQQEIRMMNESEIGDICNSSRLETLLYEDVRFIKIGKQHWMLSSWEIVNDDVYEFLNMMPDKKDKYLDLLAEFEANEGAFSKVFLADLDKRFIIKQEYIMLMEENQAVISNEENGIEELVGLSVAASVNVPEGMLKEDVIVGDNHDSCNRDIVSDYKGSTFLNKLKEVFLKIFRSKRG